ncbi:MAG: hypothetical protein HKN80_10475 [Acidimicrobiia bacterium]|nr:hypothetical protein [Acidimicrobiia bacterium]
MQTQEKQATRGDVTEPQRPRWLVPTLVGAIAVVGAILLVVIVGGGDDPSADAVLPVADAPPTTTPPTSAPPATTASADSTEETGIGERLVTAFYSFDADALTALPWRQGADPSHLLGALDWAQGANYQVVESSCVSERVGQDVCDVTVSHDFGRALDYESVVRFIIRSGNGEITEAIIREPDPILHDLFAWAETAHPDEFGNDGNCLVASSPIECAAAYARAAAEYAGTLETES